MNSRTLLLALLLLPLAGTAQSYWGVTLNGGVMLANDMAHNALVAPYADIDAAWWHPVGGSHYWMQRHRMPRFGLQASYAHIVNGIAGDRLGLMAMLGGSLGRRLDYAAGIGLSAYTRPRSITADTANIYIGSLLNCLIELRLEYALSDHWALTASAVHTSNGLLYRPNQGLNFLQMGAQWRSTPRVAPPQRRSFSPLSVHEVGFTLSPGFAMSHNISQEGYYFCYDLSLNYLYRIDSILAVGGTVDVWYNFSHPQQYIWYDDPYSLPFYIGAMAVVESSWGPLSIRAGIGPELLRSTRVKIPFYERVGAYYNFGRHYTGIALHAHAGQIDFIEWSYGYRIPVSSNR